MLGTIMVAAACVLLLDLPATHLAGLLCVKHVDQVQAKVALQPQHVVGAAVQHLCDGGAGQGLSQQVQVLAQGQRVDDVVLGTCKQRGGSGSACGRRTVGRGHFWCVPLERVRQRTCRQLHEAGDA